MFFFVFCILNFTCKIKKKFFCSFHNLIFREYRIYISCSLKFSNTVKTSNSNSFSISKNMDNNPGSSRSSIANGSSSSLDSSCRIPKEIDRTAPFPVVPARGQATGGVNCRYCGKRYKLRGRCLNKREEECRNYGDDEEMTEDREIKK